LTLFNRFPDMGLVCLGRIFDFVWKLWLDVKSYIFVSYWMMGSITRTIVLPLSAPASIASLASSFLWMDFIFLVSGYIAWVGRYFWTMFMRLATIFLYVSL
jgi:hypothetical protein